LHFSILQIAVSGPSLAVEDDRVRTTMIGAYKRRRNTLRNSRTVAISCLLAGLGAATAQAASRPCTIIHKLPFAITRPGCYRLETHLITPLVAGSAIDVEADDVTLDLQGFSITDTIRDREVRAVGILVRNHSSFRLLNGIIDNFRYGVLVADSAGVSRDHAISHVTVRNSKAAGIALTGTGSSISNSQVSDTGGSGPDAVGISVTGGFNAVSHNTVTNTHTGRRGGYAAGIDLVHGPGLRASGNIVKTVSGHGPAFGIRCGAPFKKDNLVLASRQVIDFSTCASGIPGGGQGGYPYPGPATYPFPYPYPFSSLPHPFAPRTLALSALGGLLMAAGFLASKLLAS
jgi:hypothetical protein